MLSAREHSRLRLDLGANQRGERNGLLAHRREEDAAEAAMLGKLLGGDLGGRERIGRDDQRRRDRAIQLETFEDRLLARQLLPAIE